jgi:hypothetical protein
VSLKLGIYKKKGLIVKIVNKNTTSGGQPPHPMQHQPAPYLVAVKFVKRRKAPQRKS